MKQQPRRLKHGSLMPIVRPIFFADMRAAPCRRLHTVVMSPRYVRRALRPVDDGG